MTAMLLSLIAGCQTPPPPLPPALPPPPPPRAQVQITVTPQDAQLVFDGISYTNPLTLTDLVPGHHTLSATRPGFAPLTAEVELLAADLRAPPLPLDYALTPLPMMLCVSVVPAASWRLHTADGAVLQGEGDLQLEVPAGRTRLVMSSPGYNERVWEAFVDDDLAVRVWMDREGQLVEKALEFRSGHHPKGLRFSPDGSELWVSLLGGPPSVQGYNAMTGERLHELSLGEHGAVEVLYSLDGERVYASQMQTASVFEIDRRTGEVLRRLATRSTWSKVMALHPDGGRLYVSNWVSSNITEFDLSTGEVLRELDTVDTPRGLWIDDAGQWLYAVGFGDGVLARIDLSTGQQEILFEGGGALRHVVADASRERMYISDMRRGLIWLVDMEHWTVSQLARTGANPNTIDLSPDGRVLVVSCRGQNNPESYYLPGPQWGSILILDALTGELLDAIVAGNQPTALDISADGRWLAYADMLDNRISIYALPDIETLKAGEGGRSAVYRRELWKR